MARLTIRNSDGVWDVPLRDDDGVYIPSQEVIDRLAAYEDTWLEPGEIAIVKNIVGRIATADYPHNFQRERSDIAAYMYWITSVMKDAKEWWNGMVTRNKEGDE